MNSNNEAREIRTCKKCGTPIEGDVKFCSNCGAPLGENKTSRKKKGHKLLIAAVVILGISILAGIGENGDESTSSKGKNTTGETSVRSTTDKPSDETDQIL